MGLPYIGSVEYCGGVDAFQYVGYFEESAYYWWGIQ